MTIDELENGSQISSSVDDVFYILKSCISRALSTADSSSVCTLLGSIGRILETEYMSSFQKRLTSAFGTTDTKDSRIAFMVIKFLFFLFNSF